MARVRVPTCDAARGPRRRAPCRSSSTRSRLAAEDFSFYAQKIPAAFFSVGVSNAAMGKIYHVHSPHVVIDEGALPIGAAFHAAVAIEYLNKHAPPA